MIILDTHIWIWWADNNPRLTQQHRQWIQQYQSQGLGVSMISCWEVAKLVENDKLDPADQLIVATAKIYGCPLLTADAKILVYPDVQTLK